MSFIITGTDTNVGKTLVSAVALRRYARQHDMAYWKPIATGILEERDSATVRRLVDAPLRIYPEAYAFEPPVSPHLAARLGNQRIELAVLLEHYERYRAMRMPVVIEGAGGVLVPLCDSGLSSIDLWQRLGLPCVIVARTTLGTINHTLLTIEALRARRVPIAGVVLNGIADKHNRDAITRFGKVRILGELPHLQRLDAEAVSAAAAAFDPDNVLMP